MKIKMSIHSVEDTGYYSIEYIEDDVWKLSFVDRGLGDDDGNALWFCAEDITNIQDLLIWANVKDKEIDRD